MARHIHDGWMTFLVIALAFPLIRLTALAVAEMLPESLDNLRAAILISY